MSFHMGGDQDSSGSGFFGKAGMISDINITPFVDVILVLLIIFMVTAPFAVSGVNVQLPQSKARPLQLSGNPLVLSISSSGDFFLSKVEIDQDELVEKIKAAVGNNKESAIYIRADKSVPYGKVMLAMGAAQSAGVAKIGMMGEAHSSGKK